MHVLCNTCKFQMIWAIEKHSFPLLQINYHFIHTVCFTSFPLQKIDGSHISNYSTHHNWLFSSKGSSEFLYLNLIFRGNNKWRTCLILLALGHLGLHLEFIELNGKTPTDINVLWIWSKVDFSILKWRT